MRSGVMRKTGPGECGLRGSAWLLRGHFGTAGQARVHKIGPVSLPMLLITGPVGVGAQRAGCSQLPR
jgi:hypothetical protein